MCIFEKQGKVDFRSSSVAKELIPVEGEFRLTKLVVVLIMSSVFATPINYVARSLAGGDTKAFVRLFYEVVDPGIPF